MMQKNLKNYDDVMCLEMPNQVIWFMAYLCIKHNKLII